MLEPATPNLIPDHVQPPPPPIIVNNEPELENSEILDSKINNHQHACKLMYFVCWTGYEGTDEETPWILTSKLRHTSELIVDSMLFIWPSLTLSQAFESVVISYMEIMQYTNNFVRLITPPLLPVPHFLHRPLWHIHQPGNYQYTISIHLLLKPKDLICQAHQCN